MHWYYEKEPEFFHSFASAVEYARCESARLDTELVLARADCSYRNFWFEWVVGRPDQLEFYRENAEMIEKKYSQRFIDDAMDEERDMREAAFRDLPHYSGLSPFPDDDPLDTSDQRDWARSNDDGWFHDDD